ncbi:MAG TPA: type II toxin-antitoxin system VapC family toxin [Polyangiaceae bacterium]
MDLLLDTCAIVWLAAEPGRLSKKARTAIDAGDARLFASDASTWEICLKWQSKKLTLPAPPRRWIVEQARAWQTTRLPLEPEHLYRSSELPPFHRDPFDRLLVAQAIEGDLTIVTPDPAIHAYPVAVLW